VPEETQLVKYQLSRIDPKSNEYSLTVQVPNQVSHSFDVNMVLHHANARKKTVLHLRFTAEAGGDLLAAEQAGYGKSSQATYEGNKRRDNYEDRQQEDDRHYGRERNPVSWSTYLFMLFVVVLVVAFILINCTGWDPA